MLDYWVSFVKLVGVYKMNNNNNKFYLLLQQSGFNKFKWRVC